MTTPVPPLAHLLHRLAPEARLLPDAELLRRFAEERDEAAFELLVWRHGGMVWGVCRRVAPDRAAAEDAFQAAVLALARHAGAIRRAPSMAGWLYRVAYRAALRTRSHRSDEPLPQDITGAEPDPADAVVSRELAEAIDAEVSQLPESFRDAFVLCELEGRSNAEAATALGCAVGTVESRLTRARQKLRDRLSRRGLALPAGVLAVGAVPVSVHAAAVRSATDPGSASAIVRELAAQVARAGSPVYLRATVVALVAGGALAVGIAFASSKPPADPPASREPETAQPAKADPPAPAEVHARQLGSGRFRHSGVVFHSAFSSDGKKLATAALGSVSIWETKTGKLLRRVEKADVRFHRVAFAPDDKALYVVVGPTKDGGELLTLDPETGKELSRVAITKILYYGAEFSPDASRLAVFSMQVTGEAVLFDPKAGKELARVPAFFTGNTFTADSKMLVVSGGEKEVRLYDTTTGKEIELLVQPDKERPRCVRFIPPSDALVAGNNDVERWSLKNNKRLWKADRMLPQGNGLEVSADGKRVAYVSPAVILLDGETGKELLDRKTLNWDSTSARFSPDSKVLAVTTNSGTVILRDATTGETLPQSADLPGGVGALTFSADGKRLSAVAGEKWVNWDLTKPDPRLEPLAQFIVLSPDGRVGIRPDTFSYPDSDAEFVDPATGERIAKLDPPETGETVVISRADYRRGLFSGDGKRYVGFRRTARGPGGQQTDLGVAVWDTATGKRITQQAPEKMPTMLVAVSPDGKAVAVHTAIDRKIAVGVWEPDADKMRWTREIGTGQLFATFADGGAKLVVQEFHVARVILGPAPPIPPGPYPFVVLDAATGKELAKANGPDLGKQPLVFTREAQYVAANARAIAPDGKTLAISGWDGTIYLWDLATDREKAKLSHPGPVHDLSFSPDGKTLAAASFAAPVTVYDLSATVKPKP